MTKNEAMVRFMAAKEKKRQCVARLEEKMKKTYEQRTGKPARLRSRLFERWFSAYSKKALDTSVTSSVVDEDGITNYATIIVRNDNPRLVEVIAEFTSTISLLNQKP